MVNKKLSQEDINDIYVVIGELQGISVSLEKVSIAEELFNLSDRLERIISEETGY